MSRYYGMGIAVDNVRNARVDDVIAAIREEWNIDEEVLKTKLPKSKCRLVCYGESYLTGGESEDEFVDRLYKAVWKAHKSHCDITVTATYLESLPSETYVGDKEVYTDLMSQ